MRSGARAHRSCESAEMAENHAVTRSFVGLGSNLGDPRAQIQEALEVLAAEEGVEVIAVSSLRETDPVGYEDQPRFLNGAAELETACRRGSCSSGCWRSSAGSGACAARGRASVRARSTSTYSSTVARSWPSRGSSSRTRGCTNGASRWSRWPSSTRHWRSRGAGRCRRCWQGYDGRMSHLDELDEFEAELELALKKEYSAVFSLFRYCVLTQDATYLCNRLDLQYVPQPSYPFFHLKMEDVWVWDKNRPSRIIPRAEVYTSSDVTVEELRGEGDEPQLTAEALAERIGESLSSDDEG